MLPFSMAEAFVDIKISIIKWERFARFLAVATLRGAEFQTNKFLIGNASRNTYIELRCCRMSPNYYCPTWLIFQFHIAQEWVTER